MSMDVFYCDMCNYRKLYYTTKYFPEMMNIVAGICPDCGMGNMVLDVDDELNFKKELHQN